MHVHMPPDSPVLSHFWYPPGAMSTFMGEGDNFIARSKMLKLELLIKSNAG